MKRFNIFIVLAAVCISLFMYSETVVFAHQMIEDVCAAIKLNNYTGDNAHNLPDKDKIQVVFIFDDGWESVYSDAYPIFKKYEYKGSVSIISSLVSEKSYLSYAQISELYMDEWDILNHSYSHREDMDSNELFKEFQQTREWMKKRFLTKCESMVVVPYGECNPYLIKLLIDSYYDNVRTSSNTILLDRENTVYYPVTTIGLPTYMEVSKVQSYLLDSWNEKKSIVFILHKVEQTPDQYQMTYAPNRLEAILSYIHTNEDKFQVVAYSDLFT